MITVEVTRPDLRQLDSSPGSIERFARHRGKVPTHYRLLRIIIHPDSAAYDCVFEEVVKGKEDTVDKKFGHPRFYELTGEEEELHSVKNHDYARGGNPLGNFYRVSAIKKLYPGFDWESPFGTAMDFMLKQLDAAFWMRCQKLEALVEDVPKRLIDVSVYSKLGIILCEEEK